MSTPTQTPAEMAAANAALDGFGTSLYWYIEHGEMSELRKRLRKFASDAVQAELDAICEGLDLEALLMISRNSTIAWAADVRDLHTLVSRAKRAKEGKGV